ncbi:MAG: SCP2 sterol-binding domain-containing protein [Candidatus Hodarchaeota archaeon]
MVDQALIDELKGIMEIGADGAKPEHALRVFEFFKQVAAENEEIQEELEDIDIVAQIILSDVDKKYWVKVADSKIDYGEGAVDDASFTLTANLEKGSGILMGETDATSAYMAGEISVEGSLPDALSFQSVTELAMEIFEELTEE